MTTKKILLIVGGVVAVLGFLVALFVGGIVWVAFSTIGKSEAAQTAKTFLRTNEKLKSDIGEVSDFGFWVTGNINSHNSDGEATLNLKVIGARKTVPASVNLTYRGGRDWVVVKASYRNDANQTVELLDPYGQDAEAGGDRPGDVVVDAPNDAATDEAATGDAGGGFDEESFVANVLQSEGTTLVVFLTQYVLDSQTLEKTLDELAADYSERVNLVRYSVDEQPALHSRFEIKKLPVVMVYKDGKEQERREGAITKAQLAALLDKYLVTE
ncbi:MAG TPA: cytochrome c oxidase assembly factor Coa1 family protein [Pyrinomonadaceae bacterium]|nr:cytochrome c oxidase assembly factor Coa1 family protein [Pyrinomonadaceae bacterium]